MAAFDPKRTLVNGLIHTLAAVVLANLVVVAKAGESCVAVARTELGARSKSIFGPDTIVEERKDVEAIERESMAEIARCEHCPQKPFGYQNAAWEQFKASLGPTDCIVFFRSSPKSWPALAGQQGYALVRQGRIIRMLITLVS